MKRSFNFIFSLVGLLLLSPLFALIAIAVVCVDGAPALYRQRRVGKGMREFTLYKFRTMVNGADTQGLLTSSGDKRLTRSGRFLRKWKLDELPQLLNVIKGDMQLVGCRPEVRRYVDQFQCEYKELLQQPPGITDPASLAFRHEEQFLRGTDFEQDYVASVLPRKLLLSLHYMRQRTLWSGLRILAQTLLHVIRPTTAQHASSATEDEFHSTAHLP